MRFLAAPLAVLIPEEAYYWKYSKHPAWGYLDHPPMVGWVVAGGTYLFGDSELGVRFGTLLLSIGSVWLLYRLTADWCGRRAGRVAALLYSIAPLFFAAGFLAMPDAPLIFFWLLALLAVTRAYSRDSVGWWLLAGLATGLGFMAKYPAAFIGLGALLFLLSDARGRRMLRQPGVWLALAVALLAASPVIAWNAQHDWASFRFQFLRRAAEAHGFAPLKSLASLGMQFLVLSPLVFALLAAVACTALRRFRRDEVGRWRFAVCFSLPWLAVCIIHGLTSEIHMNWPIPAYLSLIPPATVLLRRGARPLMRGLPAVKLGSVLPRYADVMVAANAIVVLVILHVVAALPVPSAFARWDRLGVAAETAEESFATARGADPFIIADGRYNLASELAFYMRDGRDDDWNETVPLTAAAGGGLNYVNWHEAREFRDRDAIFVSSDPSPRKLAALRGAFDEVGTPEKLIAIPRGGSRLTQYWVVRCVRFLGVASPAQATANMRSNEFRLVRR
ncbi:MAG: glycosyltransferase family 39 protein [Planctomycetes bacterium]|nr:glycosyltransferase family 39 protein [Planctomycetota bacterium]